MKPTPTTATVTVAFDRLADYPTSREKIALFNSGLVPIDRYERDGWAYDRCRPESLRIDLGWGAEWMPWTQPICRLTESGPVYSFDETDAIATFLTRHGVRPYWSYCYVPADLRPVGGDWRSMADDEPWVEMVQAYVAGARDRGVEIGYHEVYNEPDLRDERTAEPVFYGGDLDDYLTLYRKTSRAIRSVDPITPIGGPALASIPANAHWLDAFLDQAHREALPLDFLSIHHYGTNGIRPVLDRAITALEDAADTEEIELHLNEYNSFLIDYPEGGLQDTHFLAAAFFADVDLFLSTPALTKVSWAQFQDSGNANFSGMVTINGAAKPLLDAYALYQNLPPIRRPASVDGPAGVGAMAAMADGRAQVVVWNRHIHDVTVRLELAGAPITDTVRCTRIGVADTDLDGGAAIGQTPHHSAASVEQSITEELPWDGNDLVLELRRGAVLCVTLGDATPLATGEPSQDGTTAGPQRRIVQRSRYVYRDRRSTAWTDVDETTALLRLGTARDEDATPVVGMDIGADDLAGRQLTAQMSGDDGRTIDGTLWVRLDAVDEARCLGWWRLGPADAPPPPWPGTLPPVPESAPSPLDATQAPGGVAIGLPADTARLVRVTAALTGAAAGAFASVGLSAPTRTDNR